MHDVDPQPFARTEDGCPDYRRWTRRELLAGSARTAAGLAVVPLAGTFLPASARAGGGAPRDVIVNVFLRGGMDGLTTCVPHGPSVRGDLYTLRPDLAIAPPSAGGPDAALDLDGEFGLAPAAAPLLAPFQNGHLCIVHATGSTDPTRSHFDAFVRMELGIPEQPLGTVVSGWLARHLQAVAPLPGSSLRGLALADLLPRTLARAPATLPIPDPAEFRFPGDPATAVARRAALAARYAGAIPPLGPAALASLDTVDLLAGIDFDGYVPDPGVAYPNTKFGRELRAAAALVKADAGVEAIMLEYGGWDLHNALGPLHGDMAALLTDLAGGLRAFYDDLASELGRVVIVVESEFGRRVAQNGSLGADHGHGNCMLVLGGHVNGGQVVTSWPGLATTDLDQGDLRVTTDYRHVLCEILERRCGNASVDTLFPGYTPPPYLGIVS